MAPARKALASLDMYRKVPLDLLEGSKRGSIVSWLALLMMAALIAFETYDYWIVKKLQTHLTLDQNTQRHIKVNFNITMMDVACEFAQIDVVSFLGKQQNVSKNIVKYAVDADGVQQEYIGRNVAPKEVKLFDEKVTATIEELEANGEHAVSLDPETLKYALQEHQFVFVDYYAGWCSHCRMFAPTWETMAEVMEDAATNHLHKDDYKEEELEYAKKELKLPCLIAKVDCVAHHDLCMQQGIMGYPTIRLYVNGKVYTTDYRGHRDIYNMLMFLKIAEESVPEADMLAAVEQIHQHELEMNDAERHWAEKVAREHHLTSSPPPDENWDPTKHSGCQISGMLLMDKTPGHFYIQAHSPSHDFSPYMTNVSHMVHHLSFGEFSMFNGWNKRNNKDVRPENFEKSTHPMDETAFVTRELHQAYHHYLKLVTTNLFTYQVVPSTQLAAYANDQVPEAKFIIDLSPISVHYFYKTRRWYDYITSLMAILGGTFTVVGMVEAGLRAATKQSFRRPPPATARNGRR